MGSANENANRDVQRGRQVSATGGDQDGSMNLQVPLVSEGCGVWGFRV